MTEPSYDTQTDPQLAALAAVLEGALKAKFADDAVGSLALWPVKLELVPNPSYPLLCVYRSDERQVPGDTIENVETVNVGIAYYLPPTPRERIESRWAMLRAVWTHCVSRCRLGFDNAVKDEDDEVIKLDASGWAAPSAAVGNVRYQLAPTEGDAIPSFVGTVAMTSGTWFDFEDEAVVLAGIDDDIDVEDPPNDSPSFSDTVDFP